MPTKKTTRWKAGARRDWNTKLLLKANSEYLSSTILKASLAGMADPVSALLQQKINKKLHGRRIGALCRYKNYCAITGRARTFNRTIYMARHNVRKMSGIGLISGLRK